jgi:hypothetical protein
MNIQPTDSISFDDKTQTIEVEKDGTCFVFKPNNAEDAFDLYSAVTRIAKYSEPKAIAYLKKHSVALRAEAVDPLVDAFLSQAGFSIDPHSLNEDQVKKGKKESLSVSDYFDFRQKCTQTSPRAREIKDSETGFVMFIDPKDNSVIGKWSSNEGKGVVNSSSLKEGDSHNDLEDWLDSMSKDDDDLTLSVSTSDIEDQDKIMIAQDKDGEIVGSAAVDDDGELKANSSS